MMIAWVINEGALVIAAGSKRIDMDAGLDAYDAALAVADAIERALLAITPRRGAQDALPAALFEEARRG